MLAPGCRAECASLSLLRRAFISCLCSLSPRDAHCRGCCAGWMVRDLRMPFGGTKHSGVGREGGHDSMDFYTEVKTVCIKY